MLKAILAMLGGGTFGSRRIGRRRRHQYYSAPLITEPDEKKPVRIFHLTRKMTDPILTKELLLALPGFINEDLIGVILDYIDINSDDIAISYRDPLKNYDKLSDTKKYKRLRSFLNKVLTNQCEYTYSI